jgi:hypothetical protein
VGGSLPKIKCRSWKQKLVTLEQEPKGFLAAIKSYLKQVEELHGFNETKGLRQGLEKSSSNPELS